MGEATPLSVLAVPCLAVVVSIGVAYLLHRLVERPAQRWARRITY